LMKLAMSSQVSPVMLTKKSAMEAFASAHSAATLSHTRRVARARLTTIADDARGARAASRRARRRPRSISESASLRLPRRSFSRIFDEEGSRASLYDAREREKSKETMNDANAVGSSGGRGARRRRRARDDRANRPRRREDVFAKVLLMKCMYDSTSMYKNVLAESHSCGPDECFVGFPRPHATASHAGLCESLRREGGMDALSTLGKFYTAFAHDRNGAVVVDVNSFTPSLSRVNAATKDEEVVDAVLEEENPFIFVLLVSRKTNNGKSL